MSFRERLGDCGTRNCWSRSRRVETALGSVAGVGVEGVLAQKALTETFHEAARQVGEAAEQLPRRAAPFGRHAPKQAAGFENLQDHMGDLHQIVIRLKQFLAFAVRVFEIQAAVLLTVKALVLDVPAMPASFRGDLDHRAFADVQIGDPA